MIEWPGELLPFQLEGAKVLVESRHLLLADDMGLGKTLQVIVALRILFLKGEIQTALVVAPASVLDQWRRELLKWAPELESNGNPRLRGRPGLAVGHFGACGIGQLRHIEVRLQR